MLRYTAELKRPEDEPASSKEAAVNDILDKLSLTHVRGNKIGDALERGIRCECEGRERILFSRARVPPCLSPL